MHVRISITSAKGLVLDSRDLEVDHAQDERIIAAAQDMLDKMAYLSVGDSLTVEEVRP